MKSRAAFAAAHARLDSLCHFTLIFDCFLFSLAKLQSTFFSPLFLVFTIALDGGSREKRGRCYGQISSEKQSRETNLRDA